MSGLLLEMASEVRAVPPLPVESVSSPTVLPPKKSRAAQFAEYWHGERRCHYSPSFASDKVYEGHGQRNVYGEVLSSLGVSPDVLRNLSQTGAVLMVARKLEVTVMESALLGQVHPPEFFHWGNLNEFLGSLTDPKLALGANAERVVDYLGKGIDEHGLEDWQKVQERVLATPASERHFLARRLQGMGRILGDHPRIWENGFQAAKEAARISQELTGAIPRWDFLNRAVRETSKAAGLSANQTQAGSTTPYIFPHLRIP